MPMDISVTYDTPYGSVPFSKISKSDFLPSIKRAIKTAKAEIVRITDSDATPTFANTIEALAFAGREVSVVSSIFFNLHSAETDDEMQAIAREFSPLLTEYRNDIVLNRALFERVRKVWESTELKSLTPEQQTLLDDTYKSFVRNGALLSKKDAEKLRTIDEKLSKASLKFSENVLHETNAFELVIDAEQDLQGLPESQVAAAAELARAKGQEGKWMFNLQAPSYVPFMKYAANRDLREKMYREYATRAAKNNERNNEAVVKEIVSLRKERAALLGYPTHASFVLEKRMAERPAKVWEFLDDLFEKAMPFAQSDVGRVGNLAVEDGIEELMPWDFAYYAEKLKQRELAMDEEKLRPYFKLENVVQGVFEVARRLYGLKFEPASGIDVYHPDVEPYVVYDRNGNYKALFYADFFPRKGKRPGAWMTTFKGQYKLNGENHRPHVSIVCNFTKPTPGKPSLLTFSEVTTLFHEFGHALHSILSEVTYPGLSGTNVYWDFVELPSQIMENWCYEEACLNLFARHYESGEVIPLEEIEKIKRSMTFLEGYHTIRQVSFGYLDMHWHDIEESVPDDVHAFERSAMKKTRLLPVVKGANMSCSFSHIFSGGYSAGYYSYKWAEVLDADAFGLFSEKGIFNPKVSGAFEREILSKGGSEHPMILYKRFRGREPETDALLKRAGLL